MAFSIASVQITVALSPVVAKKIDFYRQDVSRETFVANMVKEQIYILDSNRKFHDDLRKEEELRKSK